MGVDVPQYKTLRVRRFGWKRILKNTVRFGWRLVDVKQETKTTETVDYYYATIKDKKLVELTPHTTKKTTITNILSFYRYKSDYKNIGMIAPLEFLYGIIYILRFIVVYFLPISFVAVFLLVVLGFEDLYEISYIVCGGIFLAWLVFIMLENIFAKISSLILRKK